MTKVGAARPRTAAFINLQGNYHGPWNFVVDIGCSDSGHSVIGNVFSSLTLQPGGRRPDLPEVQPHGLPILPVIA
jgi:hypothetical protein